MASLATFAELQTLMPGVTLDQPQAELLLLIAADTIRAEVAQTISLVEDDEWVTAVDGTTEVWLPERPVIDVASVTVDGVLVDDSTYRWDESGKITFFSGIGSYSAEHGYYVGGRPRLATIVYSHGFVPVPYDIRGVNLEMAKGAIRVESHDGIKSETVGPDSITYDTAAARSMSKGQIDHLRDNYRPQITSVPIRIR